MVSEQSQSQLSPLETIDLRAFIETLRIRWWIIPAIVLATVGFLQAQESDLRTEPETTIVSRSFEISNPGRPVAALGINLSIAEFPELQTQLLILRSTEVRDEIWNEVGKEISVQLPENWETPASFTCNDPVRTDCERAIDAYVAKAIEIRREAVSSGIANLRAVLVGLQQSKPNATTLQQIAALDALSKNVDVSFVLVDGFEQSVGSTVTQVRRPTYVMGIAAGLLISLIVLLQLTYTDSRVRSVRQLVRVIDTDSYLGRVTKKSHPVRERRAAIALHQNAMKISSMKLRYLTLRQIPQDTTHLSRLAQLAEIDDFEVKSFAQLGVREITASNGETLDVVVVQRNSDLRKDVVEVLAAMRRSSRNFAGVILLD